MPSDWKLINCGEEHEIVYVLSKFGKNLSSENIRNLTSACAEFKSDTQYQPHSRESFYKYLTDKEVIKRLED